MEFKDLDALRSIEELEAYGEELRERALAMDAEQAGLPFSDEQRDEFAKIASTRKEITARVTELTARRNYIDELATDDAHVERGGEDLVRPLLAAAATARRLVPDNVFAIDEYRSRTRTDGEYVQALNDGARKIADSAQYAPTVDPKAAQAAVHKILEEAETEDRKVIARRIIATGSPAYRAAFNAFLRKLNPNALSRLELEALTLGSDPDGGYMIPFALDPTIILISDGAINPLRTIARVERITGKKWQGVKSTGIIVTRHPENFESTDDSPDLTQPELETSRVQAWIPFSRELEASVNVPAAVAPLLADAKDMEEADEFINGDGVTAGGVTNPSGLIATLAAGSFVPTVGAASFGPEDVYAIKNQTPPRWRARGRYLGEGSIYDLVRQFDTSGGSNMWVQLADANPGRLIGYPGEEISTMDGDLSTGSHPLIFGDFKQFLIVDRLGMAVDVIPHVFGANGRPTGQRGVFALWANGCGILADEAFRCLEVPS
jgi:HK97 family phage major capsid protein